jgi:hypothetical protein
MDLVYVGLQYMGGVCVCVRYGHVPCIAGRPLYMGQRDTGKILFGSVFISHEISSPIYTEVSLINQFIIMCYLYCFHDEQILCTYVPERNCRWVTEVWAGLGLSHMSMTRRNCRRSVSAFMVSFA